MFSKHKHTGSIPIRLQSSIDNTVQDVIDGILEAFEEHNIFSAEDVRLSLAYEPFVPLTASQLLVPLGVGPTLQLHLFFDYAEHQISRVLGGALHDVHHIVPRHAPRATNIYMMKAGTEDSTGVLQIFQCRKDFSAEFKGQTFHSLGGKSQKSNERNLNVWLMSSEVSPNFTCISRPGVEFYITKRPPLESSTRYETYLSPEILNEIYFAGWALKYKDLIDDRVEKGNL